MKFYALILDGKVNISITEFRQKNASFLSVLNQVNTIGFSTSETQNLFKDIKEDMLAHFEKDRTELHVSLLEMVKDDINLTKSVNFFVGKVNRADAYITNYIKILDEGMEPTEEEFKKLHQVLLQRIRLEEHAIYNIYEECIGGMVKRAG